MRETVCIVSIDRFFSNAMFPLALDLWDVFVAVLLLHQSLLILYSCQVYRKHISYVPSAGRAWKTGEQPLRSTQDQGVRWCPRGRRR